MTTTVLVPCGAAKVTYATTAGDLYRGTFHRLARQAADVLTATGGRVLIVSGLYGLLELDTPVEPYEQRINQAGAITLDELRRQADDLGLDSDRVVALLPSAYRNALTAAGIRIDADILAGTRGIGDQRGRLSRIIRSAEAAA